jgi:hypothetical protein
MNSSELPLAVISSTRRLARNILARIPEIIEPGLKWRGLKPAGVGPCKGKNPQAKARATGT